MVKKNRYVSDDDDDDDSSDDDLLSFNFRKPGAASASSSQNITPEQKPAARHAKEYKSSHLVTSATPRSLLTGSSSEKRKKHSSDKTTSNFFSPPTKKAKTKHPRSTSKIDSTPKAWKKFLVDRPGTSWKEDRDDCLHLNPEADPLLRPQDALIMKNLDYKQLVWALLPGGGKNAFWPARTHLGMQGISTKDKTRVIQNGWHKLQPGFTTVTYLYSGARWLVARVRVEDVQPLDPNDTGSLWNAKARGTRATLSKFASLKKKKGFFRSFAGSLDGAMFLARKYYIKLKGIADAEEREMAEMSEVEAVDDDPVESESDDVEMDNPNTLRPEEMRAGDKVSYIDITMPSRLRNQTDRVIKVVGDQKRYPIQLERGGLLELDSMVQRVYCGKTKRKLVKEKGLHCSRELKTFKFVNGRVESDEAVFRRKMRKEIEDEAKADPGFGSLMLSTSRRKKYSKKVEGPQVSELDAGGSEPFETDTDDDEQVCLASIGKKVKNKKNKKNGIKEKDEKNKKKKMESSQAEGVKKPAHLFLGSSDGGSESDEDEVDKKMNKKRKNDDDEKKKKRKKKKKKVEGLQSDGVQKPVHLLLGSSDSGSESGDDETVFQVRNNKDAKKKNNNNKNESKTNRGSLDGKSSRSLRERTAEKEKSTQGLESDSDFEDAVVETRNLATKRSPGRPRSSVKKKKRENEDDDNNENEVLRNAGLILQTADLL